MDLSNKQFFILCILCVGLYYVSLWTGNYFRNKKEIKEKPIRECVNEIMNITKRMTGLQFENFCCELYRSLGYKAILTPQSRDKGRDIILKKDGKTYFVECKRYSSNNSVGDEVIMKAYGSVNLFGADGCLVVTTSNFTKSAYESAGMVNNIKLVSHTDIVNTLMGIDSKTLSKLLYRIS